MRPRHAAAATLLGLFAAGPAAAQTPPPMPLPPAVPAAATPAPDPNRPVAYIFGNTPVSYAEFGEFLMARGGADKLDLFLNKKIIERECARRGVTVTDTEMNAALQEDLAGLQIEKAQFVKIVLPRYGKTLYEWMEDVIRPRLLLGKLCQDNVKVSDDDLRVQFEREFGEKRKVQIVLWPLGDKLNAIQDDWAKMRDSQAEFDRVARAQANPTLAASAGHIKPISKHLNAQNPVIEKRAFELKVGEISEVLQTVEGYMVMKLHEVIPPVKDATFEQHRARLFKQAQDEKLAQEIPKCFAALREAALPKVMFTGPTAWQIDAVTQRPANLIQGVVDPNVSPAGGQQPAPPKK